MNLTKKGVTADAVSLYRGYNYSGSNRAYRRFHRLYSVKTVAILRDCQEVIAVENGFSSWAALIDSIERGVV